VIVRGLAVAALATGAVGPVPSGAQTPEQQRDEVRRQAAEAATQIDTLRAEDAVIQQALADIEANVTAQQADLDTATLSQQAADAAVAEADAAVAAAQQQVADLEAATDALLVEAFVDPPINNALDIFRSGSLTDAAVKKALLKIQADDDAALMEQLAEAETNLEAEQATKREAASLAATRRSESEAALGELQTARAQQQQLAADLEERLNARLAEAESLRQQDATLSSQIAAEQAALAARLAALDTGPAPGDVTAPTIASAPGRSRWPATSPGTWPRCSAPPRPTASCCAGAGTGTRRRRSSCAWSTAAPRPTRSTRPRRRRAIRPPPSPAPRSTRWGWPSTSPATGAGP
jgi:septal ring factor EnvC (AmiA/AmiB activator)